MSLRTTYQFATGQFDQAMQEIYAPISEAGKAAMKEAADEGKTLIRSRIAGAGFSKKWQNAMRADVYPKKGDSANAAVHFYHKVGYAGVFAEGEEITGNPMLWLPLPWAPKKLARKKLTPERFAAGVGDLVSMRSRSGRPMLGARMAVSKAAKRKGPPYKVTISALNRGSQGGATASGRVRNIVTVPLFLGIERVKIGRKFDVQGAVDDIAARLPEMYLKHLRVD